MMMIRIQIIVLFLKTKMMMMLVSIRSIQFSSKNKLIDLLDILKLNKQIRSILKLSAHRLLNGLLIGIVQQTHLVKLQWQVLRIKVNVVHAGLFQVQLKCNLISSELIVLMIILILIWLNNNALIVLWIIGMDVMVVIKIHVIIMLWLQRFYVNLIFHIQLQVILLFVQLLFQIWLQKKGSSR